jgi:UDP-N-acetylglucosamine 2-epimerase
VSDPLRVMTIVGTRPELIKLSRVLAELDERCDHVFVHTGQNYDYELNEVFFNDLDIRQPDQYLESAGDSAAQTVANVITQADDLFAEVAPDALLLLGDTNSCLAVLPAKRRKIPVFHMEAGNRCFDQRVPEEINRKVVDHLSDINLPYTEHARRYLLSEGLRPETVIKTGSPMCEVLEHYRDRIDASDILERMELSAGGYFLVSVHREENVDTPAHLRAILDALNALAKESDLPVIVSTHPRTRKRLDDLGSDWGEDERIAFLKPMGFFDYVHLQQHAACVLSDSGTITEESSLLGFPAVTLREAHERPEGMDEGTVVMTGLDTARILDAVRIVRDQHAETGPMRPVEDYQPANVSRKVVRIILSYVDYVNRTVWRK